MVCINDVKDEFLLWVIKINWGRIFANGCAAFFISLGSMMAVGVSEPAGYSAAFMAAFIQAGIAASQEFKAENGETKQEKKTRKVACLLF